MQRQKLTTCMGLIFVCACACAERQTPVTVAPASTSLAAEPAAPPAHAPTVLLIDFEADALVDNANFTPEVRRGLLQNRRAFVVLRSEIQTLLQNCGDDSCQQRVQQMSAAPYLVSGAFSRVGDQYIVRLQLMQTAQSQVLARLVRMSPTNPEALAFAAGRELAESLPQLQNP